jgi:excinuclease UvrABC nuclease subunit
MVDASEAMLYELAAKYRDLRKTVNRLSDQQKMATTSEDDIDISVTTAKVNVSHSSCSRCVKVTCWTS